MVKNIGFTKKAYKVSNRNRMKQWEQCYIIENVEDLK
jgi:hypothetical protein